jgi:glucose-6-phosphate dehydrogenase assembly protein OpcA
MREITHSVPQQIRVSATLDVQSVEHELGELWKQNTGDTNVEEDGAVMRARVLNLLVYVSSAASLDEVNQLLGEITSVHPCRVIVMLAEREAVDQDIEMFVSAHCLVQAGGDHKNLCGEQVTLKARGRFTVELPSAAIPLIVPDLPIFLWWRDAPRLHDQIFENLSRTADRVVIDSADFAQPYDDIRELVALLKRRRAEHAAISDLNWARLTSWRTLLASFYDVEEYRVALAHVNRVRIEYVPHSLAPELVAPKALILAGWLASRLGWRIHQEQSLTQGDRPHAAVTFEKDGRPIEVEFSGVEREQRMQGWIARIELSAEQETEGAQKFIVLRSEDGRYLETEMSGGGEARSARTLTGGDKTEAELVESELEILGHDRIYEEAITAAASMLQAK